MPRSRSVGFEIGVDGRLGLYRQMAEIRAFEERVSALYRDGAIPGFVHLSIGQEGSAVGACFPLLPDDIVTSTHRGHGHALAKGIPMEAMLAELMGRDGGVNRGRAGSMHIADPDVGVLGANGIVAGGLPIAVGAAFACRRSERGQVVVAFFGDGAVAQGAFHEAVNLAALWSLPILFFCENNHYAEFSPADSQHPVSLSVRAVGYGVRYVHLDGNDVVAVASTMAAEVARLRRRSCPVIVEADTYRFHGHYEGDPERYRTADEVAEWQRRDPVAVLRTALQDSGEADKVESIDADIQARLAAALDAASNSPSPVASSLHDFVLVRQPAVVEPALPSPDGELFRVMDAIRDALAFELEADPTVFIAGVDVGEAGNVFGLTRGLHQRYPDRVLDTPISETAVVGLSVGSAMAGLRPVVEIMYLDFIGVCFDQILNQAAKLHYMTGGKASMGLTIRTQFGAGRSSGSQHSQSLEALLAHIPGLTVVMPSTPADTYGLLRASIRDPNPVIFIENRLLYGQKGPRPPADYLLPLGRAKIVRPGQHLTVVSVSRMVHECLAAAEEGARLGIDIEVIDLRTVAPLDRATILESVQRTGRLLIAHEAATDFGIGAEIAATVADQAFWALDAPIRRIGTPTVPAPYTPALEKLWLPDRHMILEAAIELART